jgi:hypothetical protein
MRVMRAIVVAIVGVHLGSAGAASAQAQLVPTDAVKGAEAKDPQGFAPFLAATSTVSLTSNASVVGQVDGFSTLFGIGLTGGTDYVDGPHLLRTTLAINESFARTPVVDEFIKTNDAVKLEGLYDYFMTRNLGVYSRVNLQSSLFAADDVRGIPTSWVEKVAGGAPMPLATGAFRQRLARALHPFTINESVGGFAEPIRDPRLNLSLRLGAAGRHTFASGVLVADDDKATPEVELLRLSTVHQFGVEAFAGGRGKLDGGKASYRAGISVLFPLVNNDKADRSTFALTRAALEATLAFNVYAWMSIAYTLSVIRDPQLFPRGDDKIEVQNALLLTFQFAIVKKKETPAEPTKAQKELQDVKDRAQAAEQRAQAAEQRARAAEQRAQAAEQKLNDAQPAPPAPQ